MCIHVHASSTEDLQLPHETNQTKKEWNTLHIVRCISISSCICWCHKSVSEGEVFSLIDEYIASHCDMNFSWNMVLLQSCVKHFDMDDVPPSQRGQSPPLHCIWCRQEWNAIQLFFVFHSDVAWKCTAMEKNIQLFRTKSVITVILKLFSNLIISQEMQK